MASKFWAADGSSDSDSDDSSSASSNYSSDEGARGNENKFAYVFSESESSDDEGRVVKSGKERALEGFQNHIKSLRKHMKDADYWEIQQEFDQLMKSMVKAKQYLAAGVPRPLVRILVDLEDYVAEKLKDKEAFKKLSARQGRALNRMKLTLKKHNKAYEVVMDAYRQNPIISDEEDDNDGVSKSSDSSSSSSSSSSDSDSDDSDKPKEKDKEKKGSDSDSGEESEDWESDDDDSSSSEDEVAGGTTVLKGRARWLKKTVVTKTKTKTKVEKSKVSVEAKEKEKSRLAAEAMSATKSVLPEEGLTPSVLTRKVKELAAQRGRRGKDNRKLLRELEALARLSLKFGPRVEIPILMYVISAQFGLQRTLEDYMDTPTWKACAGYLQRIADVVDEGYTLGAESVDDSDVMLNTGGTSKMQAAANATDGAMAAVAADEKLENPHTGEAETEEERMERLRLEKEEQMTEVEKKVIPVTGSLSLHLSRLEEEYTKSLQKTSHHSQEYIARLRDESKLVELLARFQKYFESQNMQDEAASLAQLRIEHLYYRHDSIAREVDKAALFNERFGEVNMLHPSCYTADEVPDTADFTKIHPGAIQGKPSLDRFPGTDFTQLMSSLCKYVYKYGTGQTRTRAVICQIYHHALHDRFIEARDLLLMSHLQDKIHGCGDISTMIMFNRMMVNVGMCAFRLGRIYDAHQCLAEICSGRVRELLAQGVTMGRFNEKSPEQEKAEKRRLVPYHQHINLDLLEACHLISAMLLEVPNMAGDRVRVRVISRTFRKYHDQYNHQVFTGPPEQTRDFIMCAAKHLMKGDWNTCSDLVSNLDVWQLVPGDKAAERIGTMLTEKVKLEGLRTYLFAFSSQYDSLSLGQLCAMFEMTKNEVHSVVSKMMINRELHASWDQPTETIVLRRVEPTALQATALQFAEKAGYLMDANERLLDAQSGGYGYKDDWKGGDGDDRWRGNQRGYQNRGGNQRGGNQRGGGGRGYQRGGGGGRGRGGNRNFQQANKKQGRGSSKNRNRRS